MDANYFYIAEEELKNIYGLDLIKDVILGYDNRIMFFADVSNLDNIYLKVIKGSLLNIGLPEQRIILLSDLLLHFDLDNKYAEVSGKKEYQDYVYSNLYKFDTETDLTFPIKVNGTRIWIRVNAFQVQKTHIRVFFISNITDLINSEELLYEKTHKDSLTGLFNKYTFDYHYGLRHQWPNTNLFYLDLDDFKVINDSQGHQIGDEYLQKFTNILKSYETEYNRFYRIGGDEFLGLIFMNENEVKTIAEDIIKRTRKIHCETASNILTVSIGIVKAKKGIDLASIADKLLYKVKNSGKNSYAYAIEEDKI